MISPESQGAERLSERQAALVAALVAGGPLPDGFEAGAVAAAARALLRKRADEVARRYPLLAHACGADFTARFVAWAAERPKTSTATDATAFAEYTGIPGGPSGLGPRRSRWLFPRR
ncbi:hypothetical protein DFR70_104557 [Nocardia tenerifensis]|uniref:SCO6045-like C-terminal domain-containing protein n=1 Tax=Nocardia tenerifensis TaxID=228006 RepID=A0A318KG00_9NOCA|nr:hypothetical protein [Nocardia tenerifensis]PXX65493.1 hypothetical protein DFR70_104557 [Nocardia tenerifensis]